MEGKKETIWSYYGGSNPHTAAFCKEHGERSVQRGDFFYFEDGAIRGWGPHGLETGPPSDPVERQQAVVQFWDHAISKAAEHFYSYKQNVARYNAENQEIMATLKALQKQALECKRKRREAKGKLLCLRYDAETPQEARKIRDEERRRAAESVERLQDEDNRLLSKVREIRI